MPVRIGHRGGARFSPYFARRATSSSRAPDWVEWVAVWPAALALFGSMSARGADGVPDALRCGWQFDMFDTELSVPRHNKLCCRTPPLRCL